MVSIATSNGGFSFFVLSADGMILKEALVILANLSWLMEAKREEPILHVWGWVNGRIEIVVALFYWSCGNETQHALFS